jgi:uncharacterized membrane protein (UPF0127 family)
MKQKIIISVSIIIAVCLILFVYYRKHPLTASVIINNQRIYVELAVTPSEKDRGLGYRTRLAPDHGMMFLFDHQDTYPFWMKGMNFPLDYIWIEGNRIVDLSANVPVIIKNQINTLKPKVPVDKVLEVNAGTISKYHFKIGDTVIFKN